MSNAPTTEPPNSWSDQVIAKLRAGDAHRILIGESEVEEALSALGLTDAQRDAVIDLMWDQWELGANHARAWAAEQAKRTAA